MAKRADIRQRDARPSDVPYLAKVSLPRRRPAIIRRQRLLDLLSEGLERRLTLISAPAGYGKTTLLLDFAQGWTNPVCWYSLDERDHDPPLFLRYLVASLQQQFPALGGDLLDQLDGGGKIEPKTAVDLLVSAAQSADEPFVLILDDFHYLDDSPPEMQQILDGFLYRLPENCHAIVSSRTWPELGVVPLMSARQEVATVKAPDFAFTCEEVAQLFRDVLGKEISLDDAQHLADVSEGWAAALVLMADKVQAARTVISLEQLKGSDTLFQYIEREQFAPLPEDVQAFLLGSAVPEAIEPAFIDELLESNDAEEMLNLLDRRNLFVARAGSEPTLYRYHKLFRAFLVSRLRAQEPERFLALNLNAADYYERQRAWPDAVYHLLQAGAWERVAQVTERVGRALFEEGKCDTLAEWLEAIPPEELAAQPRLLLWKARILHYLNQTDQALSLLAHPIQSFESDEEWVALAEALVTKGMCLRVKGDYHASKETLTRARGLLLEHDGPTSALTEARKELGITYGMCGEFDKALQELKSVMEVYEAQGDTYNIAHVSDQLGLTLVYLGRLPDAAAYLESARRRWLKLGNDLRLVQTLNNLGFCYYLAGDYDSAERVFREGLALAQSGASRAAEVYLLTCLGDTRRDNGEYQEALDLYRSALERSSERDEAYIRIHIMDAIANCHRLAGEPTASEPWSQRATAEAEERGGVFELGLCATTTALLQRDRGQLKEAAASLERAVGLLKQGDAKRELAKAYLYLAETYFASKRKRLALDCLELTAKLAEELGYDHFLAVEARRMPLVIQYGAANKLAGGYFVQLLKSIKGPAAPVAAPGETAAPVEGAPSSNGLAAFGFGNVRVEVAGREVTDLEWRSEKSKEMFFFFLCNRRPLRKEEIVAAIWPELPQDKTSSAFHSTLYRLRQALYPECIAKDSGRYILDPRGSFAFDMEEFERALKEAEALDSRSDEAIALMEKALSHYKGPFAQDFYSEWVEKLRWQLEEEYMGLLATLAAAYTERQDYMRSADLCQQALELDEFNEAAWYRLMHNYIRAGQTEAARYCYKRYCEIIAEGAGGEAPPDFDAICREIAGG